MWGADVAQEYGESTDDLFSSYIFATQGLDLAIPSPQVYLQHSGMILDIFNKSDNEHRPILKGCPKNKGRNLEFDFGEVSKAVCFCVLIDNYICSGLVSFLIFLLLVDVLGSDSAKQRINNIFPRRIQRRGLILDEC